MDERTCISLLSMWNRHRRVPRVATQESAREQLRRAELDGEPRFDALLARGLAVAVAGGWRLTEAGAQLADELQQQRTLESFEGGMVSAVESPAQRQLSRRVSGIEAFCLNALDGPQLERTLELLALSRGDRFADLGCGVGALTQHISQLTGAAGLGIDYAHASIAWASSHSEHDPLLSFQLGDLDQLELEPAAFDAVLSIDTLYFSKDPAATLARALEGLVPGGRLLVWYSCHHEQDEPASLVQAENTPVAQALDRLGVSWSAEDFSQSAHELWRRAIAATSDLRAAFAAEGAQSMWRARRNEAEKLLAQHEAGRARRWLYLARAAQAASDP